MPRDLWWSWGVGVSYERGTPVEGVSSTSRGVCTSRGVPNMSRDVPNTPRYLQYLQYLRQLQKLQQRGGAERERVMYGQPTGPYPLYHRDD